MQDNRNAMTGAVQMFDSADRIERALAAGEVYAGPGASIRLKGAQVADLLGIAGGDTAKRIETTRAVVRGLAESSVQARKELAGQGAVTEAEGRAVEKAMSGNIDDLTVPEIKAIATLNKRAAAMKAKAYKQMLDATPKEMQPFYSLPGLDSMTAQDTKVPSATKRSPQDILKQYGVK